LVSPWTTDLDDGSGSPQLSEDRQSGRDHVHIEDDGACAVFEEEGASKGLRRRRNPRESASTTRKDMNGEQETIKASPTLRSPEAVKTSPHTPMSKTEKEKNEEARMLLSFMTFRITYLIVHVAIMLADGLQGTHLYVLYEGYGYSVASLYCLGFVSGALTSPFIGPFVDKVGRKRSAVLYCALEIFINLLEQYPHIGGLIVSRVIGGITTNLLFSVFESWLVTEHRRRGYSERRLETILRDSAIASNLAAIASGWLAHFLAMKFGPVGPFEGAVTCTAIALVLVVCMWTENHGCANSSDKTVGQYMAGAFKTIISDSKISRIGLIQGLSEGSLQTFVFLWSPCLRHFSRSAPPDSLGLDSDGEPAYGLIFGAFMACGVMGGLAEPSVRKVAMKFVRDKDRRGSLERKDSDSDSSLEDQGDEKPVAVEFLTTVLYVACAALLMLPYLLPEEGKHSFTIALCAFLVYELMVGMYMPCEGIIRSIYMPTTSICSLMTMLRVIVNVAVAMGVLSTNYVPFATAFAAISGLMVISFTLQLSLVSPKEWENFVECLGLSKVLGHSQAIDMSEDLNHKVRNKILPVLEFSSGAVYSSQTEQVSESEEENISDLGSLG